MPNLGSEVVLDGKVGNFILGEERKEEREKEEGGRKGKREESEGKNPKSNSLHFFVNPELHLQSNRHKNSRLLNISGRQFTLKLHCPRD